MLRFAFVSDAAEREYKELPDDIQDEFGRDLRYIQYGQDPLQQYNEYNGQSSLKKNNQVKNPFFWLDFRLIY